MEGRALSARVKSHTGRRAAAVLLLLLSISGLSQVAKTALGWDPEPLSLSVLQFASGSTALVGAIGAWIGRRWSAIAAALYGVITGAMIIALGPLLSLDAEERRGLPLGALIVLLIGLALAWYLHRVTSDEP